MLLGARPANAQMNEWTRLPTRGSAYKFGDMIHLPLAI